MSKTLHKILACLLLIGLLATTSCQEDTPPNLEIGFRVGATLVEAIEVEGDYARRPLVILTDPTNAWTVTTNDDWLWAEPASGTGEFPTIVVVDDNTTGEPRIGTVTVTVGSTSRSVTVTQQPIGTISIFGNPIIPDEANTERFEIRTYTSWTVELTSEGNFAELVSPAFGSGEGYVDIRFQARPETINVRRAQLRVTTPMGDTAQMTLMQGQPIVGLRLELPEVRNPRWFIQHFVGDAVNFSLEYDTAQRHAVWVAYVLTAELLSGTIERDNFTFDPMIPIRYQPHERDRSGNFIIPRFWSTYRYERGHILASADRRFSQEANDQTNFMSNISPHLREFHNNHRDDPGTGDGVWLRLENQIRTWARRADIDTLYVVKGGSIIPGAPGTEIKEVLHRINSPVVPRWHFKAVVQRRGDSFYGIAFWLEQYRGMARRPARRTDAITIRELETLTNINFFPNLRLYGQQIGQPNLEDDVETTPINWARWPGIN